VLYGLKPFSFNRTGLQARFPVEAPCWRPKTTMAIVTSGFGSASRFMFQIVLVLAPFAGIPFSHGQSDGSLKGSYLWTTGSVFLSSPAIGADGTIYIGSENSNPSDSFVLAIDPEDFTVDPDQFVQPKWAYRVPDWIDGSPAVAEDGTVYIGCWDGKLYAFRESGSLKWTYDTGNYINSSPAIGLDGTIYVGSGSGDLHAINPDGSERWLFPTVDWVDSSPAIGADGTVYVGSWDYSLYAINADGEQRWSFATEGPILSSPAIGADGTLYVGSDDGSVYAIDSDGKLAWKYTTGDAIESSPALGVDGTIYVGSLDGYLYAIAADGSLRWRYFISYAIISSPAVREDGSVVFGGGDNKITCLSSTGDFLWSVETGDWVDSSPGIAADGTIYVGSFDNRVYAINGSHELANSAWPEFRLDSARTGVVLPNTPTIAVQPFSLIAAPGDRGMLQVFPADPTTSTIQWLKGGTEIPGETSSILDLGAVGLTDAGTYQARVYNMVGEVWSEEATVQVVPGVDSRLTNISTRGEVIGDEQAMIPGFVTQGTGNLSVLIRGVGPTLTSYGVAGANPDPRLEVIADSGLLIANDRWGEAPNLVELTTATLAVGAFPLDDGSEDAAALVDLVAGRYTAKVTGVNEAAGITLVEAYEVAEPATPVRLVNISNRGRVGTGSAVMIPGFVISGEAGRAVLIRGIGPTLADFGVTGFLEDPRLFLYRGTGTGDEIINANDDWVDSANPDAIAEAAALVGAFDLGTGYADAAILTVLPPGKYTALVEGAGGGSGEALVEVYRLP
jgi:outer membrane protein assembly factor BamB